MQKPRNNKIRAFLENWKMDYHASCIPDRSKPQCWICYEILCENKKFSVKRHYLSKHATTIETKFPIHSDERKNIWYRNTRTKINSTANFFKGSMTENQCITFASYKIAMQIAKCQNKFC